MPLHGSTKKLPQINTLIKDIHAIFTEYKKPTDDEVMSFALSLAKTVGSKFGRKPFAASLWMSNIGSKCQRKLWYSVHEHEKGEQLPPSASIKFLFGDILELLVLFLSKLAGHEVTDQQKSVELDGVRGRLDARIDGELVDIKSSSSFGMAKFQNNGLLDDDPFNYLSQLGVYAAVEGDSRGHFLVIDKQLGHIELSSYAFSGLDVKKTIANAKTTVALTSPPPRGFEDVLDGKSGNRKLCTACSYCNFNKHCWPGLRTFIYSRGPVYLTRVAKLPDVPEIKE
jgi:hypothetical protein